MSSRNHFKRLCLSGALAAGGLLLAGCGGAGEPASGGALEVAVQIAALGEISVENTYIGTVSAESVAYVIPFVSGEVTEVNVKVGDRVLAGDVLGRIDDQPAQLQLDSANAAYGTARASADSQLGGAWQSQSIQTQSGIDQILASINMYERQLQETRRQLRELESSLSDTDAAKSAAYDSFTTAQAKYMTAANIYTNFQQQLTQNPALATTAGLSAAYTEAEGYVAAYILAHPTFGSVPEVLADPTKLQTALLNQAPLADVPRLSAAVMLTGALRGTGIPAEYLSTAGVDSYKQEAALAQSGYEAALSGYSTLQANKPTLESAITQLEGAIAQSYISLRSTQEIADITEDRTRQETKRIFDSQIAAAGVGVEAAELQLEYYTLKAPISGVVESVGITAHGLASPSAIAFTIANAGQIEITLYVNEDVRSQLRVGQTLRVERKGADYDAVITELGAGVDPMRGMFMVRAAVDTRGEAFANGASVTAGIKTQSQSGVITVPYDAVYYEANSAYVYVAREGTAQKCYIETGITNGEQIAVLSGITPGDAVITSWGPALRDGREVSYDAATAERAAAERARQEAARSAAQAAEQAVVLEAVPEEPAQEAVQEVYVEVAAADVKLRAAPSTNSDVIRLLEAGERAVYLAEESGWYYVRLDGEAGYISARYSKLLTDAGGDA